MAFAPYSSEITALFTGKGVLSVFGLKLNEKLKSHLDSASFLGFTSVRRFLLVGNKTLLVFPVPETFLTSEFFCSLMFVSA